MDELLFYNNACTIWNKIAKNNFSSNSNFEIKLHQKLLNIFHVGNYYFFIFNCYQSQIEYTSDSIIDLLGYDPKDWNIEKMLQLIHPDDKANFMNFENEVAIFFNRLSPDKIFKYKVSYDYRIRKSCGNYIRVLQQATTIDITENGGVLRTLVVHTDISHVKKENKANLTFIGLDGEPTFSDVNISTVLLPNPSLLSKREKELLSCICMGKNRTEIGDLLNISKHTVDTHRRKILKKTSCSSTTELVAKSIREGWI